MTTKADFTDEEWVRLERAPFIAAMGISLADPGGPIEAFKESMAAFKTVSEAAESGGDGELAGEVARSVAELAKQRKNPVSGFRPKGALAGEEILEELRGVNELVTAKATPEDAAGFREFLLTSAKRAADAAKEGGFLGFKAERVSEGEQKMLDKLGEALS